MSHFHQKENTWSSQTEHLTSQGWGKDNQAEHKGFLGSENILYDFIMMDYVIIDLTKPIEFSIPRRNPKVLWTLGY